MKTIFGDSAERDDSALRARDGIVTGAQRARGLGRAQLHGTWVLVARSDEHIEDFFLESPFGVDDESGGEDPVPWICRLVRADGTLRLGTVDLEVDRFVSDVLSDQLDDEIRDAIRKSAE